MAEVNFAVRGRSPTTVSYPLESDSHFFCSGFLLRMSVTTFRELLILLATAGNRSRISTEGGNFPETRPAPRLLCRRRSDRL